MKSIDNYTQKEFKALGLRGWNEDIGVFDSLVILPTRRKHDSGYRMMDFVAVKNNKPICRLSGCSDVVHIGGLIGEGLNSNWSIDCLSKSGLLRLFNGSKKIRVGAALSSFEVFTEEN